MKNIKPSEDGSAWAATIGYPNGVTAAYDYYPITGTANDARLREIHSTANGGATLSKFIYEYDPAGRIQEWQQQLGATSASLQTYTFGYTRDNELRDATLRDNTGGLIEERSWQYDLVGNRLRQSLGGSSTYWHHNDLNQIEREGGAGTTLVEGTVDEPAIVEVDVNSEGYKRAAVLSNPGAGNFLFRREVDVNQGLNTIDVRAEDASGNQSTVKNYELTLPATAKTYEYDLNGNLRFERDSGGSVLREFRWDAQNRFTHIIEGSNETEFEYDGQDRRRRIIERVGGIVQDETTYLWADGAILQRRSADEETIEHNYYWFGFSEGASDYFYTRDHLGSVREVIASNGTTIESRYDYDLWGNVSRIAGTGVESDFLFTGHFYHETSNLHLAQYRAYDSERGRWLSRDPMDTAIGLEPLLVQGPNLYAYAFNNPTNYIDDNGLWVWHAVGAGVGAAFDIGAQLATNGGSFSDINWGSVGVSAASGAMGVGLGANVARMTGSTLGRAALNGVGSAGIGAAGQMAKNAMDECADLMDGVGTSALVSGGLGAAGSLAGDAAEGAINSLMRETPLVEGLRNSNVLSGGNTVPENLGTTIGTGAGVGISNAGPVFE